MTTTKRLVDAGALATVEPGLYWLGIPVANPRGDKRKRYCWYETPEFPAGLYRVECRHLAAVETPSRLNTAEVPPGLYGRSVTILHVDDRNNLSYGLEVVLWCRDGAYCLTERAATTDDGTIRAAKLVPALKLDTTLHSFLRAAEADNIDGMRVILRMVKQGGVLDSFVRSVAHELRDEDRAEAQRERARIEAEIEARDAKDLGQ